MKKSLMYDNSPTYDYSALDVDVSKEARGLAPKSLMHDKSASFDASRAL